MTDGELKKPIFEQIRDYILREAKKNYGENIPFSARHFAQRIDEAKKMNNTIIVKKIEQLIRTLEETNIQLAKIVIALYVVAPVT